MLAADWLTVLFDGLKCTAATSGPDLGIFAVNREEDETRGAGWLE